MIVYTASLTIDDLRVSVITKDAALYQVLQARYHAFASPVPVRMEFRLSVESRLGHAPLNQQPYEFRSGVLHFTATHYLGWLDVAQRSGRLSFTAPGAFEAVDYAVRAALALLAFEAGGLLFHAAGLVHHDRAYAFFGPSGSGKTTVARLSPHAEVLNDDLLVLRPQADRWLMHATPFYNPTQIKPIGSRQAPITALFRLIQDRRVYLEPIDPAVATAEIIASCPIVSADPDRAGVLIDRVARLACTVPVQQLHFLPNATFWSVIDPQSSSPRN